MRFNVYVSRPINSFRRLSQFLIMCDTAQTLIIHPNILPMRNYIRNFLTIKIAQ